MMTERDQDGDSALFFTNELRHAHPLREAGSRIMSSGPAQLLIPGACSYRAHQRGKTSGVARLLDGTKGLVYAGLALVYLVN